MRIGVTANVGGDPERPGIQSFASWPGYPTSSLAVWVMRNSLVPQRRIQVRYVTVTKMRGYSLYRRSPSRVGQCDRGQVDIGDPIAELAGVSHPPRPGQAAGRRWKPDSSTVRPRSSAGTALAVACTHCLPDPTSRRSGSPVAPAPPAIDTRWRPDPTTPVLAIERLRRAGCRGH
jgi:hypothetical protein